MERIAVGERHVDAGDARLVGHRADDDRLVMHLELGIAAGVIVVVVGVEDVGRLPAKLVERRDDRPRHRRVDDADRAAVGLAQQVDVIVLEDRDDMDIELAHASPRLA